MLIIKMARYMKRRTFAKKRIFPRKSKRVFKRRSYRSRGSSKFTPADNRVGFTQRLKRQGPYRRKGYQPIIKGTGHRAESYISWNSSVTGPAANNMQMIINNFGAGYKIQSGTPISATSQTGFDAYYVASQNAPYGFTKCFSKGVKVKLLCTNTNELAGKVRITFAKLRRGRNGSLPAQWNTDVNRPIATRHWKVIKSESFIMEPFTYTDAGAANGSTVVEKNFYIPINKWRETITADAATSGGDWNLASYAPQDAIYMFVDTNDSNPTGSVIGFQSYIIDYFSTIETTQT